jgi:Icc-related predicted phosphoesterase
MNNEKIKFVCISDTHGMHNGIDLPDGDVLIHTGDFTGLGLEDEVREFADFLKNKCNKFKHRVVIAGNHELTFDESRNKEILNNFDLGFDHLSPKEMKKILSEHCTYLENSGTNLYGYNIWGSPYSSMYHGWAFMGSQEYLEKIWQLIPKNTDILLTHGPPFKILDLTEDGENVGCKALSEKILEIKPLYNIFGHIHESYGEYQDSKNNITYVNASSCNLRYLPDNKPYLFELESKSILK